MHIMNLQIPHPRRGKEKSMLKSMFPALVETDFVYDYRFLPGAPIFITFC
jgi:hypothetical protein